MIKALARSSTMGSNSLYPRSCRCCPARRRCVAHRAASAANATPPPSPCACGRPSNGPAVQKRAGPEMGPLRCVASPAMGLPRAARRTPAMEPPRGVSMANGSRAGPAARPRASKGGGGESESKNGSGVGGAAAPGASGDSGGTSGGGGGWWWVGAPYALFLLLLICAGCADCCSLSRPPQPVVTDYFGGRTFGWPRAQRDEARRLAGGCVAVAVGIVQLLALWSLCAALERPAAASGGGDGGGGGRWAAAYGPWSWLIAVPCFCCSCWPLCLLPPRSRRAAGTAAAADAPTVDARLKERAAANAAASSSSVSASSAARRREPRSPPRGAADVEEARGRAELLPAGHARSDDPGT